MSAEASILRWLPCPPQDSSRKKRDKDENSFVGPDFEPWANKRGEILARYTTTEKLSIVSTQLPVSPVVQLPDPRFLSYVSVVCVLIGFLNNCVLRVRGAVQI